MLREVLGLLREVLRLLAEVLHRDAERLQYGKYNPLLHGFHSSRFRRNHTFIEPGRTNTDATPAGVVWFRIWLAGYKHLTPPATSSSSRSMHPNRRGSIFDRGAGAWQVRGRSGSPEFELVFEMRRGRYSRLSQRYNVTRSVPIARRRDQAH